MSDDVARVDVAVNEAEGLASSVDAGMRVGEALADLGGNAKAVGPQCIHSTGMNMGRHS